MKKRTLSKVETRDVIFLLFIIYIDYKQHFAKAELQLILSGFINSVVSVIWL